MKVRCVRLLEWRGRPTEHSAWARIGAVYHVLAIWIEPGKTMLSLIGEEPVPALFEPEMFEVVSPALPGNWVVTSPKAGCLSIAPEPWTRPGFWQEFFDRKADAVACFEEEYKKTLSFDP